MNRCAGWGLLILLGAVVLGCGPTSSGQYQGYIEGEMVYVAAALPGTLERLPVQRGVQVKAGELLFVLENQAEQAARRESSERWTAARYRLEDLKKGRRTTEMEALQAKLDQAQTSLDLSQTEFKRWEELSAKGVASASEMDRVRSTYQRDQRLVTQLRSELETGRLGAREDEIKAAEAEVAAAAADLSRAEWNLAQKQRTAPADSLVFDTLFNQGEWVPAGGPVVALLPPANIKVRFFVPQATVATIRVGQSVTIQTDGLTNRLAGHVKYVSPQAEFTPPVIYSQENRAKLVFMIEAAFAQPDASRLHPGQPVDVRLNL